MNLIRRLVWGLVRSLVTFVVLVVVLFIALWAVQKFAGFNALDDVRKGWHSLTDGSWKRGVGSIIGAWFLLWLVYDALMSPNYYANNNQVNNYRQGRGFIDLDGNGRDDRWQ